MERHGALQCCLDHVFFSLVVSSSFFFLWFSVRIFTGFGSAKNSQFFATMPRVETTLTPGETAGFRNQKRWLQRMGDQALEPCFNCVVGVGVCACGLSVCRGLSCRVPTVG